MDREKDIEMALKRYCKVYSFLCLKFISPGWIGAPDRLILTPDGRAAFVELKAPGKKPRPMQVHRGLELQNLGFDCFIVDSKELARQAVAHIADSKACHGIFRVVHPEQGGFIPPLP